MVQHTIGETAMEIIDSLFEGEPVLGTPSIGDEYGRKMPGSQDANGDHCT